MPRHGPRGLETATTLLLALGVVACDDRIETPVEPDFALQGHRAAEQPLLLYTQNVYLGGQTSPIFSIDFSDIPALIAATNVFWGEVQASDIPSRAAEIVDEIAARGPHLVVLQEVLQFVLLDGAFNPVGGIDILNEIQAEISDRGLPYATAIVQPTTSSALPLATDGIGITQWLAFTDRLVTLRRTDVELKEAVGDLYAARIPLGPLDIVRGWTRTTVEHQGLTYHAINTHLETQQTAVVQAGQAAELQSSVVAGLEGITVISGDLNSNAIASSGDPTWTPTYGNLIDAGFVDVWATAPHGTPDPGLTCCHPNDLVGVETFSQRIDFVLVRSSDDEGQARWHRQRGVFRAEIVGEDEADRTQSGLWPSDHAGLFGEIWLPR
jgi:hypothetical protein